VREVKAAAGGDEQALRIARIRRYAMNIRIDPAIERLETAAAIRRSIDATLFNANIYKERAGGIEGDRSDVRDMRRRRETPALASGDLEECRAFAKLMAAVEAAHNACVRSADEDLARTAGGRRNRPYLFVADVAWRDVLPTAAAVC